MALGEVFASKLKWLGRWCAVSLALLLVAGCQGKHPNTSTGSGAAGSANSGSSSSSGGTQNGSANSSGATGTGGSSGTSSSTSSGASSTGARGTTTGTGSTTGFLPSSFIDGGYVLCAAAPEDDAGDLSLPWTCQPGTYFCGSPRTCAQCRSDADCSDERLPTYDSHRPRCDLDSGVPGYQGFCQQCLSSADCAGFGDNNLCNLSSGLVEPSIVADGFETCANLGVGCGGGMVPSLGGCVPSGCATDADCASAVSTGTEKNTLITGPQQAKPFCVDGECNNLSTAGYFCPNCLCENHSFCRDPRAICDVTNDHCACTDSSQCGGAWPICELAAGSDRDDAGQLLGSCGCQKDTDCGDAGLRCLDQPGDYSLYDSRACLFSCNDPRFPDCADLSSLNPICNPMTGLCGACTSDAQCTGASGGFVGPDCLQDGTCGCRGDDDCPHAEVCRGSFPGIAGGSFGACVAPPAPCTPASCRELGGTCDWDSGACVPESSQGQPSCLDDFDCAAAGLPESFCDPSAGGCVGCRDSADCVAAGFAIVDETMCAGGYCQEGCNTDSDCLDNFGGPSCLQNYLGVQFCGCGSNSDCGIEKGGLYCITDPLSTSYGSCGCRTTSDCPPGPICNAPSNECVQCADDAECGAGLRCDPYGRCKPRCDDGGSGCDSAFPACDSDDALGLNSDGGALWCYECVTGQDCPSGEVCGGGSCYSGQCFRDSFCHAGQVCDPFFQCETPCDAGACPAGLVCDSAGLVGPAGYCYECLSPLDCPNGEGCNSQTSTCGTCSGPGAKGGPYDCPPGAICSNYWSGQNFNGAFGVCLQSCDAFACQNPGDTCAIFPSLSPDHFYCFGCLQDSDCADAGKGWRCDTSVKLSFTCKPPGAF